MSREQSGPDRRSPAARGGDPVAIVAIGCRFPGGVSSPEDLWRLLAEERDAVSPLPADRGWDVEGRYDPDPARPGTFYQREANLLERIGEFAAGFFGISPREAAAMDPQQRLLLETAWETFEHGGIVPGTLHGSETGVFIGAIALNRDGGGPTGEGYRLTGNATGAAAGRIAYSFGLEGPALSVDTGQSSSLVALHLAVRALRAGECSLALAGGATVMAQPDLLVEFSRQRALSPDGRSRAFSAQADGFGLGEGVGLVLLERLSDARRNGHEVLAVVRGSAVNQDGASNGLTAPNGASQQRVIRDALADAGLSTADIDAVEAHGTGTTLGDPIEAQALLATYGRDRSADRPLWLGSVKSNIGHAQAAAGVAGVIKMVLALRHDRLPRTLHVDRPTSDVDWSPGTVSLLTEPVHWPAGDRPRRAGVSSFGISGTNAHLVLEQAPAGPPAEQGGPAPEPAVSGGPVPWVLSATTPEALRGQARRLLPTARRPDASATDIAWSLARTRARFDHRAVVTGADRDELLEGLAALAGDRGSSALVSGRVSGSGQAVMVFPGQGAQWPGMARELYASSPVFAEAFDACAAAISVLVEWNPHDLVSGGDLDLARVDVVQPALFAVMVSLARLWCAVGVEPGAVIGHSQGEIAAAHVAGALSLEDAARVVVLRSRALTVLSGRGGMLSVPLAEGEVVRHLGRHPGLGIAAVNGPAHVVVSGDGGPLAELHGELTAAGVRSRMVPVDYASHGPHVDEVRERVLAELAGIAPRSAQVPFFSTLTGAAFDTAGLTAEYWFRNLREPVEFARAQQAASAAGHAVFIEVSPHPVLVPAMLDTIAASTHDAAATGTLRRDQPAVDRFVRAVGRAHADGANVDWTAVLGSGRSVPLPTYAFDRERFPVGGPSAVMRDTADPNATGAGEAAATGLANRLGQAPAAEHPRLVRRLVRDEAAAVLGHGDPRTLADDRPFRELGFDSLTAVDLIDRLNRMSGLRLPPSTVFAHPTVSALSGHLLDEATGADTARGAASVRPSDEPVAIVGIGCRFPGGVGSAEDLWRLVTDGVDAVGAFPADRGWSGHGTSDGGHARAGGFLHDGHEFDAAFFGVSPREAAAMDPQQRLLLETAWEAIESAGIAPDSLKGSATGVFAGTSGQDYAEVAAGDPDAAADFGLTGSVASVMSGRVAYALGLHGPAMTVDTACSSSLVAVHLAAQALRRGECTLALAGGVTFMSTPGIFDSFSRQGGLAADGRCKSFAEGADGTGWSEGAGLVVVERLSDALRNGHEVLAVIRGSAVNQDGASNGLTAPNGASQQRVIRSALADAGLAATDVDAVEAHGTGTRLGDPIEAQALLATYGRDRPADRPVWLGSVKSNIGHTQAAAGIAGVIKTVMALRHGRLPKTLHVDAPSSRVDWSAGALSLLTDAVAWPETGRPHRAAVSSFGISGTNAHLVLEQAPEHAPALVEGTRPVLEPGSVPWVLSAKSAESLRGQAGRLLAAMREREAPAPIDVGWSLAATRARFDHRAVVTGSTPAELLDGLSCLAEGRGSAAVASGRAEPGGTALVFSGQGAQWPGMARGLYASSEVFRSAFDEVCAILDPLVPGSLAEVVFAGAGTAEAALLDRTDFTQPALFAVEVALHALVRACGVRADVVAGHSVGEIAAAHVAGVLSLRDACVLVAARGRLMAALPSTGAMLSLEADEATAAGLVEGLAEVGIGAVNGPASVVVSGDAAGIDEVATRAGDAGIGSTRLRVGQGFHSPLMDPMLEEFAAVVAELDLRAPDTPVVSTVTGRRLSAEEATSPAYWVRHARETVRYHDAVRTLAADGIRIAVEIGPDSPLSALADGDTMTPVPLMRRPRSAEAAVPEPQRFLQALAKAHVSGADVDWAAVLGSGHRVALPTYAFDRRRYWIDPVVTRPSVGEDDARLWDAVDRDDAGSVARVLDADEADVTGLLPILSGWRRRRRREGDVRSWHYDVSWSPVTTAGHAAGRWLVLVPADAPAAVRAYAPALGERGITVAECAVDGAETDREALAALIGNACADTPVDGVLSLLAWSDPAHTPALVQALGDAGTEAPLWCATWGAVPAGVPVSAPEQAAVWGAGRVAALEHPDRWGGLVDLPPSFDERAADALCAVLAGDEDQVAIRGARVLARRLVRAAVPADGHSRGFRGTVLLTGGTGGLGGHLTRWLLDQGAEHVLVLSRSGPDSVAAAVLLTEYGDRLSVVACDVAERDQVAAALEHVPEAYPLTAVVHAAGVMVDGPVASLSRADWATVSRPKVAAAWNLHELTRHLDLDAFIMFSSGAGVVGAGGLAAYGAANAFLDAFAEYRRGLGLPATAVAWGAWADEGMAVGAESMQSLTAQGMRPMASGAALAALRQVLNSGRPTAYVADLEWERFAPMFTVARPSRLFAQLPDLPEAPDDGHGSFLDGLPAADREEAARTLVQAAAAEVLGHTDPSAVADDRPFREQGFDSLTAVELRNRVNEATGLRLPSSVVFDHPTVLALSGHVLARIADLPDKAAEAVSPPRGVADEPVAIVGIGCRFPGGVASADDLWRLVAEGGDAIGAFPTDRGWDLAALLGANPDDPGGSHSREGGFLYDGDEFDAGFFGVAPREAVAMDPQQRLLLETAWETVESAGIAPGSLKGSATGVFTGTTSQDYATLTAAAPHAAAGYGLTGAVASVLSGRIAYTLGLEGPAVTVDTACSSSLVALHMAVQALRRGECSLALAGGATFMSTPSVFTEFSRQGGLAADGRCKSFAGAADGTGWGEGVGLLLVERLSDALRNGHEVLAVVRGSAVNQDGASNGLTAPNGPSQQRVIRGALADAGLDAGDVDAVEAHGTGTTLGDPIEAQALLATYGRDRPADRPLRLGSVKSNIGHTQAASGVAGVIKMVMALRHNELPATLHVDEPTPEVDWSEGAVSLLTEAVAWPEGERPRRAGVSSFGISGTNVHLILEQAPVPATLGEEPLPTPRGDGAETGPVPAIATAAVPWVLSAKTPQALRGQAERLLAAVDRPDVSPIDVGWSLAYARSRFDHRAVVTGSALPEFLEGLSALAEGYGSAHLVSGAVASSPRVVMVFPGQGAQWAGMAGELYGCSPVFAEAFDECAQAFAPWADWDLRDLVSGGGLDLERVDVVQPVLFAVMVSLARLWRAVGVEPAAVIGHSQGEIAAAYVAGALSLEDAARVVVLRSRALSRISGLGGMLSVPLPESEVREYIGRHPGLGIAAVNGPGHVVVSGDAGPLADLHGELTAGGVRSRLVPVDYASHSAHVDGVRERVLADLAGIVPRPAQVPFFSTLTGQALNTAGLTAEYWFRNLREPVEFAGAQRAALAAGHTVFIEVSPHPVLLPAMSDTIADNAHDAVATGTLRRDEPAAERFLQAVGRAHAAGADVDWAAVLGSGVRVPLPTYAFDRQRFWVEPAPGAAADVSGAGITPTGHPLLGAMVEEPGGGAAFTARLSQGTHPWLADHSVAGTVVVPGTAIVEMAGRSGDHYGCDLIGELVLHAPMVLPEHAAIHVRVHVGAPGSRDEREVTVHSRPEAAAHTGPTEWTLHATGALAHASESAGASLGPWPPVDATPVDVDAVHSRLAAEEMAYGPAFRGLRSVWHRGQEVCAEVELPVEEHQAADAFLLHPALLDAALHALAAAEGVAIGLPFSWSGVRILAVGATAVRARIVLLGADTVAVSVFDAEGEPVATVDSLTLRPLSSSLALSASSAEDAAARAADRGSLFTVDWVLTVPASPVPGLTWAVLDDTAVDAALRAHGVSVAAAAGLDALLDGIGDAAPPDVVVWTPPTGPADVVRAVHATTSAALAAVRRWLAEPATALSTLVVLTRGATVARAGETPDLAAATLWGMLRSAQAEHPGRFVLLDLDDRDDPGDRVGQAVLAGHATAVAADEPQIAVREGEILVPRATRVAAPTPERSPWRDWSSGTLLITGAAGRLGGLVARHAAEAGVGHLLLISRRRADELGAELVARGTRVTVVACDAADHAAVAAALDALPEEFPLRSVVHAAGVLDDGVVESLTPERVDAVLRPKVDAAWNLHELTRDRDLDAFVLFSSFSGVSGVAGQSGYAAANTFLDALALLRRAQGLPATSLAWGLWENGSGMTGHLDAADLERVGRLGVRGLPDAHGLALLDAALARDDALLVPVRMDLAALGTRETVPAPLWRSQIGLRPRRTAARAAEAGLARRLAALSGAERRRIVEELVLTEATAVLGHTDPDALSGDRAFRELGFDSLTAVELRNRINELAGLRLPASAVFDHPTPNALAGQVLEQITGDIARPVPTGPSTGGDEPIAIVGIGCRFPGGVTSPEDLWRLVAEGVDAIGPFPTDRAWPSQGPDGGRDFVREGGFVHDGLTFDPGFFGISPREALAMDPQQRLLLETAWEAIESAGIAPDSLKGSRTGVFAGLMYHDYGSWLAEIPEELRGFFANGNAGSVATGRVSYEFGFEGPAVTVDTACSSSLVALHMAVQALRRGECDYALAGGVTFMSTPGVFTEFSLQGGLAADGRCKPFANAADGTGFGEGVGLLLVERLSDALRNGHEVLAVVRGSAVNQDGASNGLTAPNGPSQQRVIRGALADAGLGAGEVDAVEAHGTGTTLGDPIEAQALLATYGRDRPADRPLHLGSVKSNIGHTQAAAGVAGVIKMVMALRNERLPKTLHADAPTSRVDWSAGAVSLLTDPVEWPQGDRLRRAAVSSFGISGTNAHIILEEAPESARRAVDGPAPLLSGGPVPWVLSAATEESLRRQAGRLLTSVSERADVPAVDVGWSLAGSRARFDHRAVVTGSALPELLEGLSALAEGYGSAHLVSGAVASSPRVVMVFPGQGAQWAGMAGELYGCSPVFAEAFHACAEAFAPWADWDLRDLVSGGGLDLERVDVVQPVLFAVMVSLARLWRAVGVEPAAVIGHSQGEIAAAYVAGALSLEDAARVVVLRSRALTRISGLGGMLSVPLPEDDVAGRLGGYPGVGIAAVNGPGHVVVSGDTAELEELHGELTATGVRSRMVPVDYASHGPHVDRVRERVLADLAGIVPRAARVPFFSAVTGESLDTGRLTADYWFRNLREPVRVQRAQEAALAAGHTVFVEVSPHPVLLPAMSDTVAESGRVASVSGTLRRDEPAVDRFVQAVGRAHVAGADVDWATLLGAGGTVPLPTYAFDRQRFWVESAPGSSADVAGAGITPAGHPLLGAVVESADDSATFTARLSLATHPWLADHEVAGTVVVPGAALVEMVGRAGDHHGCDLISELVLQTPMVLGGDHPIDVRVAVGPPGDEGQREVAVHSRTGPAASAAWTLHATGVLAAAPPAAAEVLGQWPPADAHPIDVSGVYARLAGQELHYGPVFQGLRAAWRDGRELYAEVALSADQHAAAGAFLLHPALLDAALHILVAAGDDGGEFTVGLPFSWSGVRVSAAGATGARARIVLLGADTVAVSVFDAEGEPVASVDSLTLRPLSPEGIAAAGRQRQDSLFTVDWVPADAAGPDPSLTWAVLDPADRIGAALREGGVDATAVADVDALVAALDAGPAPDVVVWPYRPTPVPGVAAAVHTGLAEALSLVQRWLAEPRLARSRLLALTERGVTAGDDDDPADLEAAPLWGMLRSAQAEHPDRLLLVDARLEDLAGLPLAVATGEPQAALRGSDVLVPRLVRPAPDAGPVLPRGPGWRLGVHRAGTVDDLDTIAHDAADRPLTADAVRLRVHAAGLNFRDVLVTLDMRGGETTMGSEGAGVVIEAGADVSGLRVGDRVLGLLDDAFSPVAVADPRMLVRVPAGWSFTDAAAVPVVFLTAYYGLRDLAGLKPGETVLVHAGTGGVGMAAVRLARHFGAEVFATASEAKWDTLRAMGLDDDHIASSRTLDFEDKVLRATGGRGVDVVLDSLTGRFVDASLRLLPHGGRFIEIGKRDIRDADEVAVAHPGVAYRAFDLVEAGPERIGEMLAEIMALFDSRAVAPLPVRAWPASRAREAFRHLAHARHIGKVVLTLPEPPLSSGTVLVTGGAGHLGGLVARHAAALGAGHVLVVGRRGADAPGADALRADLAASGTRATFAACDAADRDALAAVVREIPADLPLRSVVHAAGVLDDGVVESLTPERVGAVLRPKVDAAWNLHELTRDRDLDAFVLFSSAAGITGTAGQAGYAAANVFLDALARHRRELNLPGVSLAWGLWERGSGMTSHLRGADLARMARTGVLGLTDEHGIALLDAALGLDLPVAVPLRLDAAALNASGPAPLWRSLARTPARRAVRAAVAPEAPGGLVGRLAPLAAEERSRVLAEVVRGEAAAVLGRGDPRAMGDDRPFRDFGFDSLTAVELRNRLSTLTGVALTATAVFDYPTVAALTRHLLDEMLPDGDGDGDGAAQARDDADDAALRRRIDAVPIARLRESGLLDALLRLAEPMPTTVPTAAGTNADIETMDVAALVRAASALEE
uniref:Type I modular polyketide synthase n=1 Tax=Nocardiopsis sp. CMB-M0232 TaxID=1231934 RepID=A0A0D5BTU7_9ACTN|nr:type I modular polyketide synthase [Nocardiopsis sp. CMB-M0232]